MLRKPERDAVEEEGQVAQIWVVAEKMGVVIGSVGQANRMCVINLKGKRSEG